MAQSTKFIQSQKFKLAGSGIGASDTSITLQSMKLPDGSTTITSSDIGNVAYGTLAPGSAKEEIISFTGITQNGDGTATLTGVTRGLNFVSPYTTVAGYKNSHAGGTVFILSNTPQVYDDLSSVSADETIDGSWTFSALAATTAGDPVADNDLARKAYVDNVVAGSFPSERTVVAGTAGETIADGEIVYYDDADNEWKLADASTSATADNVLLGVAQGAGTDGNAITNGVLLAGLDDGQTGMTVGAKQFLSDTAGALSESAGTVETTIGWAKSATELYFSPRFDQQLTEDQQDALAGTSGTPSTSNKYVTADDVSATSAADKIIRANASGDIADEFLNMTTAGDLVYTDGTDLTRLAIGTAGQVLKTNSGATAPEWGGAGLSLEDADVTQSAQTDIGTGAVEQYSYTVPANTLGINDGVRVTCLFTHYSDDGSGSNTTWNLEFGGTVIATVSANLGTSEDIKVEGYVFNNGATNSQRGVIVVHTTSVGTLVGSATTSKDTTSNQAVSVDVVAPAANSDITFDLGMTELLPQ